MAKLVQLIIVISSILLTDFSKAVACPKNCQCLKEDNVECTGNIDALPTGIPTDTQILLIHNTSLMQIPGNILANMTNLKEFYLLNNKLLTTLHAGLFDGNLKLRKIAISYNNKVTVIPDGLFQNLPNLETIFLKKNGIVSLPGGTFRNLPKLNLLNMEKNQIRSLPTQLFDSTVSNINDLNLNQNELSSLSDEFFRSIAKSLRILLLGVNKFKQMPVKALKVIEKLEEIDVLGNPLYCNCSLRDFVDWATGNHFVEPPTVSCSGSALTLAELNLDDCAREALPTVPSTTPPPPTTTPKPTVVDSTPTFISSTDEQTTKSIESTLPRTQPPQENGDTETQDSSDKNQRKTIILAGSISAVVIVIFVGLILCLFHTGILSSERCKVQKNKMVVYDEEGNIFVKDGQVVT